MTATKQRDLTSQLAPIDPARALAIARKITDPWFACQALAWVARYAPDNEFSRIINESFKVGRRSVDRYQVVASAAWPVRASVERGKTNKLTSIVSELLTLAREIKPASSKSEALFLLYQAVFPAGHKTWVPVLHALRDGSVPMVSWQQRRNLHDAVLMAWKVDQQVASKIANSVADAKLTKQIATSIAKAKYLEPRPFFWTNRG